MKTWEDMFDIARVQVGYRGKRARAWFADSSEEFQLKLKVNGEVVGKYKDYKYCEKQAKYKFKQAMKRVERTLLVD